VTRSRAYKKNDQAFVEQKNGAVVRRLVGYGRFWAAAIKVRLLIQIVALQTPTRQSSNRLRRASP